ncbi:12360_t:CDS:2 [Acaulospora colombiana]|uniref:12360_t:CDS:1 n=1 Tax=Acaulospora colombiana TaxID=27376 RepID=A0ACA9MUL1_9GLOM|nr:12360_t:CDS:2 [Acaulospora colombiana]
MLWFALLVWGRGNEKSKSRFGNVDEEYHMVPVLLSKPYDPGTPKIHPVDHFDGFRSPFDVDNDRVLHESPLHWRPVVTVSASLSNAQTSYCPSRPATEAEQQQIFEEFYQALWVKKDVPGAFNKHVDVNYINHNPYATSGRQNAINALSSIWSGFKFTLANKGFSNGVGWLHQKMESSGQPFQAVVDILRMNGTCIMEHWDVAQSKPSGSQNPIALF